MIIIEKIVFIFLPQFAGVSVECWIQGILDLTVCSFGVKIC